MIASYAWQYGMNVATVLKIFRLIKLMIGLPVWFASSLSCWSPLLSVRWLIFCVLFAWSQLIMHWALVRFKLVDIGGYFIGAAGSITKRELQPLEGSGQLIQSIRLLRTLCGDAQLIVWEHSPCLPYVAPIETGLSLRSGINKLLPWLNRVYMLFD